MSPPSSTVSPPIVHTVEKTKDSDDGATESNNNNVATTEKPEDEADDKAIDPPSTNVAVPQRGFRPLSRSDSVAPGSAVPDSSKIPGLIPRPTPEPPGENQLPFHGHFPILGTRYLHSYTRNTRTNVTDANKINFMNFNP